MSAVVLVTGGASGIGAAVARRFARDGAHVVIADVAEAAGTALAAEIDGLFVRTDVSRDEDNQALVDAALPALTTNGGAFVVTSSLAGISPASFDPVYSATKHAIIGLVRSFAAAVQSVVEGGGTGESWVVRANQPPAPVAYPAIELSRACSQRAATT